MTLVTELILLVVSTDMPTISILLRPVPTVYAFVRLMAVFVGEIALVLGSKVITAWEAAGRQRSIKKTIV